MELVDGCLGVSGSPYLPWPASSSDSTVITARFRLRLGMAGILLRCDGPGNACSWRSSQTGLPSCVPPRIGRSARCPLRSRNPWQRLRPLKRPRRPAPELSMRTLGRTSSSPTTDNASPSASTAKRPWMPRSTAASPRVLPSTKDPAARPSTRQSGSRVARQPCWRAISAHRMHSAAGPPPLPSANPTSGPWPGPPPNSKGPLPGPGSTPRPATRRASPSTAVLAWRPPTSATRESISTTPPTSRRPCNRAMPPP
jgi:hypothetical protein